MANKGLSLLTAFTKGAVGRSLEIDEEKRVEAEKRKLTSLSFAKEAYKADLERYKRFQQMKDHLAMGGKAGFASALASNYKIKNNPKHIKFITSRFNTTVHTSCHLSKVSFQRNFVEYKNRNQKQK